jgi:hypothetical protein
LPAHAARLSMARVAITTTATFFMEFPQGSIHQIALWGIALRRLVQKNHTNAGFGAGRTSDSLLISDR